MNRDDVITACVMLTYYQKSHQHFSDLHPSVCGWTEQLYMTQVNKSKLSLFTVMKVKGPTDLRSVSLSEFSTNISFTFV